MSIVGGLLAAAAVGTALTLTTGLVHEIVVYAVGLLTGLCYGWARR